MLKELNAIARGLPGLHGHVEWPSAPSGAIAGAARCAAAAAPRRHGRDPAHRAVRSLATGAAAGARAKVLP